VRALADFRDFGFNAHLARRLSLTNLNIRRSGRPVAFWKLFKVSGPWAQRRRRSARAAIATARFILAVVTKI
jgi:hypothetical protein